MEIVKKKVTRKGAGRTKGSFSFVPVTLETLNKKFAGLPDLKLLVSRKQMEAFGLENLVTGAATDLVSSISGQTEQTQVKVNLIDLD